MGTKAPEFVLTKIDLTDVALSENRGKRVILNIFPSIDTSTCASSVRRFNTLASGLTNTVVLCISKDLPYAQKRFCGAEGIANVICLSEYKDNSFSDAYCIKIVSGSTLIGLFARSVIVINETGHIIYTELVHDVSHEPDYDAALKVL